MPLFVFLHRHPKASSEIGERPFPFSGGCRAGFRDGEARPCNSVSKKDKGPMVMITKFRMLFCTVASLLITANVFAGVREDIGEWRNSNVGTLRSRIAGNEWQELPDVEDGFDMSVAAQNLFGRLFGGGQLPQGRMEMFIDNPKAKLALWNWRGEGNCEHEFSVWKTAKIERPLHYAVIGIDGRGRNVASYVVDELGLADREYILKGFADERRVSSFSVKGKFSGETYVSPFADGWFYFVDDQPYANWSHPCRYVFVSGDMSAYVIVYSNEPATALADGMQIELERIGGNVRKSLTGSALNQARAAINAMNDNSISFDGDTSRSYAVIISGGGDKDENYSRYWGDVAMIYSTLRLKYAIPKDHIKVCVSDGTSTANDMFDTGTETYRDSPKDLDGDGYADIEYDAKKATIKSVLQNLSGSLTGDDQLFVFITDHGAQDSSTGISYLVPWLNGNTGISAYISPTELSTWLAAFNCPVAVAMEYCYSGPFINPIIQTSNRAVGTACGNEPSSAFCWTDPTGRLTGSILSGAFDYCNPYAWAFNSAIRGADSVWTTPWRDDIMSQVGNADTDGDGKVSFYEAAQCAKSFVLNTTQTYEGTLMTFCDSPQYGESSSGFGSSFFMVKNGVSKPTIPGAPNVSISGTTLSCARASFQRKSWLRSVSRLAA